MKRISAIWKYTTSGSSYDDLTSNNFVDSDFNFIAATTNTFYFGFDERAIGLVVDLATNGSYTNIKYEYRAAGTWKTFYLVNAYNWDRTRFVRWVLPKDWIKFSFTLTDPNTVTSVPVSTERYQIRITCTAVTTMAIIDKIREIVKQKRPSLKS